MLSQSTSPSRPTRTCAHCTGPLPRPYRSNRVYCSKICSRSARFRSLTEAIDHLWQFTDRSDPDGCWPWTRALRDGDHGYGTFQFNGRKVATHRFAWEVTYGPIPDGFEICHHCDNPPCNRPDHFFLGTHLDNHKDKLKKQRHPYGERHGQSCFTDDQIRTIRQDYATGTRTILEMAEYYNTHRQTLYSIVRRETWKHLL